MTEDGSSSIYNPELDETYHSTHGAIQESNHVFIDAGLHHFFNKNKGRKEIKIFEVGFGTGLNALLTSYSLITHSTSINYTSIELNPLDPKVIGNLNYPSQIVGSEPMFKSIHRSLWGVFEILKENFALRKIHASFLTYKPDGLVDLIFFDAFSPDKQPELWTLESLKKCYKMLSTGGVFVTYSAKGQLKRDLKSLHFEVESLPGPPGKFEMIRATKN